MWIAQHEQKTLLRNIGTVNVCTWTLTHKQCIKPVRGIWKLPTNWKTKIKAQNPASFPKPKKTVWVNSWKLMEKKVFIYPIPDTARKRATIDGETETRYTGANPNAAIGGRNHPVSHGTAGCSAWSCLNRPRWRSLRGSCSRGRQGQWRPPCRHGHGPVR